MDYRFVLDSGSSHHVFDSSLRQHMGKHVRTAKVGEGTAVEMFVAPAVTVGTLPMKTTKHVVVANLLSIRQASGENINGILGIDFFLDYVIQLDCDEGKLNVLPKGSDEDDWGEPMRLMQDAYGRPSIRAHIGSAEDISLLVDTGQTTGIVLAGYLFRHLQAKNELNVVGTSRVQKFSETSIQSIGCLTALRCGPFAHTHVFVQRSETSKIGMAYLSRYKATFDLANKLLYLKPGATFGEKVRRTTSGLRLLLVDQGIVVDSINKESGAVQAGIQPGDIITHVDEVPASTLGVQGISRRLAHSGKSVVMLRLRRLESTFNVRVMLRVLECEQSE